MDVDLTRGSARCLKCNALLLRGRDETEAEFEQRARVHADRHAEVARLREISG